MNNKDNCYMRCIIIEKLTDQELLKGKATNDKSWHVRYTATRKLMNEKLLETISIKNESQFVRRIAVKRLTGINITRKI